MVVLEPQLSQSQSDPSFDDAQSAKSCYIMGTTTLAVQCAEMLQANNVHIYGLITDDPYLSEWGQREGIPIHAPSDDLEAILKQKPFDYFFNIINFKIIPDPVLKLARRFNVNYHDGPLPRYAGVNATFWALVNKEKHHGIAWHVMTEELDAGDILEQESVEILPDDRSHTLNARCYEAAIQSFARLAQKIGSDSVSPAAQDLSERTYFEMYERLPATGTILWDQAAEDIIAPIHASDFGNYDNNINLSKLLIDDTVYVVKDAKINADLATGEPGVILEMTSSSIVVSSQTHAVELSEFRLLDGEVISVDDIVERHQLQVGSQLTLISDEQADNITTVGKQIVKSEQYWRRRLKAFKPTELPYVNWIAEEGAVPEYETQSMFVPLPITDLINKHYPDQPAESVLLGGLFAFLLRLCNTESVGVGYSHDGIDQLVGNLDNLFEKLVPLQISGSVDQDFRGFVTDFVTKLEKVQKRGTYPKELYARYPQEQLKQPDYPIIIKQGESDDSMMSGTNRVLTIHVNPTDWMWEFDTQMLPATTVDKMQHQFLTFLEQALTDDSLPLIDHNLIPEKEYHQLIHEWNDTAADYPYDKCLHQLFEEQVAKTPNDTALIWQNQSLTYLELEQRANQLAQYLQKAGVKTEDFVGIYVNRSIDMVVALVATHKAGAAYIPLDPGYPANRIELMIEDSGISFVIANSQTAEKLPPADNCQLINLDTEAEDIRSQSTERVESDVTSDNLAYVIYTSGSTGRPKGVMVRHRNVANFFTGMDEKIQHDPPGVWLTVTSISFDISVLELFYTLARGFQVVIYSDDTAGEVTTKHPDIPMDISLFFFGSHEGTEDNKYHLVLESAKFADENGLSAVWTPERHFHAFGGLYPNPSVLSAGLATITQNIQLRSGSLVSPLHDTVRIVENWSVVDNLSNGRVGISFAAGWQPNDFVIMPDNFKNRKELMFEQIEEVRHLWKGGQITRTSPTGDDFTFGVLPHPIQDDIPVWITAAGNPETFRMAGENGYNLLTHLLGQTFEVLEEKVAIYRQAWKDAGHPGEGHVSLMLHTYVDEDQEKAREIVREPMKNYLRSAVGLVKQAAWSFPTFKKMTTNTAGDFALEHLTEEELEDVLDYAFERYYETSGLFGTFEQCTAIIDRCKEIGVNDIACLIDYLTDTEDTIDHLAPIKTLLDIANPQVESGADHTDYSIPALIERHNVTHLQSTPSLATMLVTAGDADQYLGQLKQIMIGGEAFPKTLATQLEPIVNGDIINMYGPTETTIWSSTFTIEDASKLITIGRPIANTQLYILDSYHQIVPIGVEGELYIGGDGVVRGYLHRPDLTQERFIPNPFSDDPEDKIYKTGDLVRYLPDGQIEYLGRMDHQVKIRGYRIEIGEIEARLGQYPDIVENVVVARDGTDGSKQLVAYFTTAAQEVPSTTELREFLGQDLPDFMIPARFMVLDKMPLTPNGKINRLALPEPNESRPQIKEDFTGAENKTEEALTDIWSRNLDVSPIGVHDNFFELGGHSLLAVSVVAEIKEKFGVTLPLATFFKASTIRELAEILHNEDAEVLEFKTLVQIQKGSPDKPPFYCVHAHGGHVLFYYDVARLMGEDQPFYGLQSFGIDGTDKPLQSIEEMAAQYVSEIQMVQPHGPYYIGGDCMGGVIAFEMAQQLKAKGEEIALLAMVDSYCPATHPKFQPIVNNNIYEATLMAQRLYGFYFKRWLKLPAKEKRRMEADMVEKTKFRVKRVWHKLTGNSSSAEKDDQAIYEVHKAHDHAVSTYMPKAYEGDIVLLNADIRVPGVIREEDMGWTPYVKGQIEIEEFPGYFNTGFFDPSVPHLAESLKKLMNEHQK